QSRLEEIIKERGMEKRTIKTITAMPRLVKDLEKVRELGFAIDDEENNMGARCLAAPIFNQDGIVEASLGLSGTINQVNSQSIPRIVEALKDAARQVSVQLGYRGTHRRRGSVA
ncbi:MAG TPA: IclR family transcriptional regulator C-terminal domain-containing protein, partial [Candidatus Sulfotelmatobacter sp.]